MPTPLSLIFNIAAVDSASAVFGRVGAAASLAGTQSETGLARVMAAGSKMASGFAVATAAAAVLSVKMAADFETATNQLVTSAGETASNLGMIRKGLLDMAGQVGVSATELAKGMYQVESAGFHGGRGLDVMKAAAQGAKAEGAQMETVAGALTTVLNNYGKDIQENAVKGTNFLVATVSLGKTRMEDFSSSISNVLPVAKSAGIGLAEVGGAMATMTAQGISSDQAATYLRQTIVKLADQTPKAKNEMKALGLESIDVAGHLGERGLAGTLQVLTDAIGKHLGPDGLVMLDSLKKAGQNADLFQVALSNLPPAAQTYIGALTTMVGGQKTMMGALSLTGDHMKTFTDDTAKIKEEMDKSSGSVNGFALVQTSFNQKMDVFKASVGALAIEMGTKLLPAVTSVVSFLNDHPAVFQTVAIAVAAIGIAFVATRIAMMAYWVGARIVTGITMAFTAAQWLLNAALSANPIALVVVTLALLATSIIYAYKHSETFRGIVDGAFRAVAAAAQFMWNDVIRPVFKFLVDVWLAAAGAIVHGAALAFGWVPGIGEKLKAAASKFDTFRDDVNQAMSGINDKTFTISANLRTATLAQENTPGFHGNINRALGGPVYGPGTGTSDSIPAMLSNGEFVMNADATARNLPLLHAMNAQKFAAGGLVINAQTNQGDFVPKLTSFYDNAVNTVKESLQSMLASYGGGSPGGAGGAAQWAPLVAMVAAMLGLPASVIPGVLAMINSESGGNPNAINLTDCVTLDTVILTQRGWLKHDAVMVGDQTIGLDLATGRSRWTTITRVVHYQDAPLVRLGNSRWHATVTANHTWVSAPRVAVLKKADAATATCPDCSWPTGVRQRGKTTLGGLRIHRAKMHNVRTTASQYALGDFRLVQTRDVNTRDRLVLAAVADTGAGLPVSDTEAAILGWIAGDGHIERGRRGASMSIAQSKPDMVIKLKALLATSDVATYVDERLTRTGKVAIGPRHVFRFKPQYRRDMLAKVGHPKDDAVQIVLGMSASQRRAWLDAFIDAEGHRDGKYVSISQTYGSVLEAAHLAAYLCGYRPRLVDNKITNPDWSPSAHISLGRPVVSGSFLKHEDAGVGDVWCVTTELGTWTAEQDGQIFLTGNSNAAAGHPSRGLLQTIPSTFATYRNPSVPNNIVDPLANIYAGMSYALNNYGLGMLMSGGRHTSGGGYLGYERGTDWVPRTGPAILHEGEAVLSRQENSRRGPTVNMSGQFFSYDPTELAVAQERKLRDAMALEGLSR